MRLGQFVSNEIVGVFGNNILDKEVVGVTGRGGEQDNDGDEIVLKQASGRRMERPVASPDLGEGQDTFTPELLNNCIGILISIVFKHAGGNTYCALVRI